jgi:formiminoglutamase
MTDWLNNYAAPKPWFGRIDGIGDDVLRWHQRVQLVNLRQQHIPAAGLQQPAPVALVGFACDEGVRRNQGRTGARMGPNALRKACSNLPVHFPEHFGIIDFGDITCQDTALEQAQLCMIEVVANCQQQGFRTLLFGGGHEITWPHYCGIRKSYPDCIVGIIQIDAHFDNRPMDPSIGATSGTGFLQIAEANENTRCLVLGIQPTGNTPHLYEQARKAGTTIVPGDELRQDRLNEIKTIINDFAGSCDVVYITLCMDVFQAAFAPGVSAPAGIGLVPDATFIELWDFILKLPAVVALDVAELCPQFDLDERTARLAASLVFRFLNSLP